MISRLDLRSFPPSLYTCVCIYLVFERDIEPIVSPLTDMVRKLKCQISGRIRLIDRSLAKEMSVCLPHAVMEMVKETLAECSLAVGVRYITSHHNDRQADREADVCVCLV